MKGLHGLRRFFRIGAFRPDPETDLDHELQFHLRRTEEELLAKGFSPTEAREEARRRFGDLARYRKELSGIDHRAVANSRRRAFLEAVSQDLAYTFRGMRRAPGFSVAVILTLALGIGANATMFGVVDRLLLSPPAHIGDPDDVVRLLVHRISPFTGRPGTLAAMTYLDYQDFRAASSLESVAAFGDEMLILGRGQDAERVNTIFSTASYFPLLQVWPALGRFFDESEAQPGAPGVVILGHGLWERRFGEDPAVIGRELSIGDGTYTVIGVAPEGFNGVDLASVDLFLPIHAYSIQEGSDRWREHRGYYWLKVLGRIAPASSREVATEEATALHMNGRREMVDEGRYPEDARIVLGSVIAAMGPDAPGEVQVSRWLVGVTLIVLLIACANVANLLLARGQRRQRELGIRVALGISRRRLVGQLLLESSVLAALGGAVGLLLAHWGGRMMRTVFLPEVAWTTSPVNTRVLFATLALVGITGLLAGMAPAWKGSRTGVVDSLKEGGRGGISGRSTGQAFLLVTQAALSVVLLVGAGLFVRSLDRAQGLELGLNPEGLILATLELDGEWEESARRDLATRAADRLETLPGVVSASYTTGIPFWSMSAFRFFVPGMDSIPAPRTMGPFVTAGSSNHLSTMGIQLREGRMFSPQEATSGARVAVVTENMAAGLWGGESALGQCFMVQDRESPCWEVVGVVEDSKLGLIEEAPWQYFLPLGPTTGELEMGPRAIFIRTQGEARNLLSMVQQELKGLDPRVRFAHVRLFQDLIDPDLRSWTLGATMFSLFGLLALLVAMVGLYSVLAFNVARRTRELGVRAAMGASRVRLLSMVLRQALMVTGVGVALGLVIAALAASRVGPLLFDTSPRDPLVLGGAALVLLLVAVVAGAVPAWAASKVDPMGALRAE